MIGYIIDNTSNDITLKNCLFSTITLRRNKIKREFIYNDREIAFDGADLWSFDNDFAGNVLIFDADSSSTFYADNQKYIF